MSPKTTKNTNTKARATSTISAELSLPPNRTALTHDTCGALKDYFTTYLRNQVPFPHESQLNQTEITFKEILESIELCNEERYLTGMDTLRHYVEVHRHGDPSLVSKLNALTNIVISIHAAQDMEAQGQGVGQLMAEVLSTFLPSKSLSGSDSERRKKTFIAKVLRATRLTQEFAHLAFAAEMIRVLNTPTRPSTNPSDSST